MQTYKYLARGLIAAGMMALAAAPAARADQLADIKTAGTIRFGTEMHYAPFDVLVNGEYAGFDRDLADAVAKEIGVKAEYQDLPWDSVLPGLDVGKFDFVSAPVTITAERMKRFAFTYPIADATLSFVKRAGDDSISKPEDVAGKTVGSQKGSAELEGAKAFAAGLKDVKFSEYGSFDEAYADLAAGRVDAVANGAPLNSYLVVLRKETFATVAPTFGAKSYYAWVGRAGPDSAALVAEINRILAEMQDDGRLAEIQRKWLGAAGPLPKEVPLP